MMLGWALRNSLEMLTFEELLDFLDNCVICESDIFISMQEYNCQLQEQKSASINIFLLFLVFTTISVSLELQEDKHQLCQDKYHTCATAMCRYENTN